MTDLLPQINIINAYNSDKIVTVRVHRCFETTVGELVGALTLEKSM
jgi:hypothetical protein